MANCPKITILSEQQRGKTFELTEESYSVGRIEERDICIPDPTISTYHGSFIKSGNTYIFKDNNSTNGSRVNNVPIVEQELKNSDILQLGDVEMLYDCQDKSSVSDKTSTMTGINLTVNPTSSSSLKQMETISPYAGKRKENDKKNQKISLIILGALGLVVVVLLVYLFITMGNAK